VSIIGLLSGELAITEQPNFFKNSFFKEATMSVACLQPRKQLGISLPAFLEVTVAPLSV
jgi:hypothetical protein